MHFKFLITHFESFHFFISVYFRFFTLFPFTQTETDTSTYRESGMRASRRRSTVGSRSRFGTESGSRRRWRPPRGCSSCSSSLTTRQAPSGRERFYRHNSRTPLPSTTSRARACSSTASTQRSSNRCASPWRTVSTSARRT